MQSILLSVRWLLELISQNSTGCVEIAAIFNWVYILRFKQVFAIIVKSSLSIFPLVRKGRQWWEGGVDFFLRVFSNIFSY